MRVSRRCRRAPFVLYLTLGVVILWLLLVDQDAGYEGNLALSNVQLIDLSPPESDVLIEQRHREESRTEAVHNDLIEQRHREESRTEAVHNDLIEQRHREESRTEAVHNDLIEQRHREEARTEAVHNDVVLEQLLNDTDFNNNEFSTKTDLKAVQFITEAVPEDVVAGQWDHEQEDLAGLGIFNELTSTEFPINNDKPLELEKSNIEREMELFLNNLTETLETGTFNNISSFEEGLNMTSLPGHGIGEQLGDANLEQSKLEPDLEQYQADIDTVQPMENNQSQQENGTTLAQDLEHADIDTVQPMENNQIQQEEGTTLVQDLEHADIDTVQSMENNQSQQEHGTTLVQGATEQPEQVNITAADPGHISNNQTEIHDILREITTESLIGTTLSGLHVEASAVNRTSGSARLLVYNRVPKCGSTTFKSLLVRLALRNDFDHESSKIFGERYLSHDKEREFVEQLMERTRTSSRHVSVDRHVYFIDFTKYGYPQPIYMNVLRDPIEKFVSTFYYIRSERRWQQLLRGKLSPSDLQNLLNYHKNLMPPEAFEQGKLMMPYDWWLNKNLSQCVLSGDLECQFQTGAAKETSVSYFCGSLPLCRVVNSAGALQRAKYNLERYFAVVGVVEQLDETLAVMEQYVPRYLGHVADTYRSMGEKQQGNKTPHPQPEPHVREVLSRRLVGDLELYNFAKQRLYLQHRHLRDLEKLES